MQVVFLNLIRSITYGLQNFGRNVFLSIATTSVMVLTLFGLGFFIIINQISNEALVSIQSKVDMSVYLKDGVEEQKISEFQTYVDQLPEVASTQLISKEEALNNFRDIYKDNSSIIDSLQVLDVNPLPVTLVIRADGTDDYEAINNSILSSEYAETLVDETDFQKESSRDIIERLNTIINTTRTVGIVIIVVLALIAVLITYNTIRLTMYSYRNEVEIMRLVGANDMQIKGPFVVEGILFGLFGTFISFLILLIITLLISEQVSAFIGSDVSPNKYIFDNVFVIIGAQLVVGCILGVGSSVVAINRYLKV